jgi:hypothetical protein
VVEILRVEIRWLGQCFEVGGALRELGHDAHGYVTATEVHPETPTTAKHPIRRPKTALQLEAAEPHAIAIIAISFSRETYRCQTIYCAINIALEC